MNLSDVDVSAVKRYTISVIGVCAVGASAIGFYIWRSKKFAAKTKVPHAEIEIPTAVVGHVIGRYGEKLEEISTASRAKIKFVVSAGSVRCIVKGSEKHVKRACDEIRNIIEKNNRNVESVNQTDEIKSAKTLDSVFAEEIPQEAPSMIPAGVSDVHNLGIIEEDSVNTSIQDSSVDFVLQNMQKLVPIGDDDLIPVYVSAISHPEQFWVQSLGSAEYAKLDYLSEDLAEFYRTNPSENVPPPLSNLDVGSLCAFYDETDSKWYRAEINRIIVDGENVHDSTVDLYMLDTGDSVYGRLSAIRVIPKRFLQLHFQAVQCSFANIEPVDGEWTDEIYTYFVKLTHVADRYKLMARVNYFDKQLGVYYIDLYDTSNDTMIDIQQELVDKNFAKYIGN